MPEVRRESIISVLKKNKMYVKCVNGCDDISIRWTGFESSELVFSDNRVFKEIPSEYGEQGFIVYRDKSIIAHCDVLKLKGNHKHSYYFYIDDDNVTLVIKGYQFNETPECGCRPIID